MSIFLMGISLFPRSFVPFAGGWRFVKCGKRRFGRPCFGVRYAMFCDAKDGISQTA